MAAFVNESLQPRACPPSPARSAAGSAKRRCRPTPASISTTAGIAARSSSRSPATAASSVPMGTSRVRPSSRRAKTAPKAAARA